MNDCRLEGERPCATRKPSAVSTSNVIDAVCDVASTVVPLSAGHPIERVVQPRWSRARRRRAARTAAAVAAGRRRHQIERLSASSLVFLEDPVPQARAAVGEHRADLLRLDDDVALGGFADHGRSRRRRHGAGVSARLVPLRRRRGAAAAALATWLVELLPASGGGCGTKQRLVQRTAPGRRARWRGGRDVPLVEADQTSSADASGQAVDERTRDR